MRILRRIAFLAILFAVGATVFQNQESLGRPTEFAFLHWHITLVLGFWLFFSFVAGGMLFLLFDAWRNLSLRWKVRKLEQELATTKVPVPPG